jgi:hypothetical protein
MKRSQKITFGEMRDTGVHGILIYCSDYRCSHSIAISADQWPDDVRIRSTRFGSAAAEVVVAKMSMMKVSQPRIVHAMTARQSSRC